jgi:hypothetical protein
MASPWEWKNCTTFVMSIAAVSGLTLMASIAKADPVPRHPNKSPSTTSIEK